MMFGIDSLYVWLAVIIISVAVEAFTLTLCGIWFAASAVSRHSLQPAFRSD